MLHFQNIFIAKDKKIFLVCNFQNTKANRFSSLYKLNFFIISRVLFKFDITDKYELITQRTKTFERKLYS